MASSCRPEPQEHYYAYMLRRTREENAKERKMNDQAMIDKLSPTEKKVLAGAI